MSLRIPRRRGVPTTSCNIQDLFGVVGLPTKREEIFNLLAGTPEGEQTPKELAKYGARWAPYRSVASWYLWRSLETNAGL